MGEPHVKIARKAYETDLFWNEPRTFSRWEAWEDLIQEASWKPRTWTMSRGRVLKLQRGETIPLSHSLLATRWNWTVKQVRCFLDLVIEEGRLRAVQRTRKGHTYLLVNYEHYQGGGQSQGIDQGKKRAEQGAIPGQQTEAVKQLTTNPPTPLEAAVDEFCERVGCRWNSKLSVGDWCAEAEADHPAVDLLAEVKKATAYWEADKRKVKKPALTLGNWLKNAKPKAKQGDKPGIDPERLIYLMQAAPVGTELLQHRQQGLDYLATQHPQDVPLIDLLRDMKWHPTLERLHKGDRYGATAAVKTEAESVATARN